MRSHARLALATEDAPSRRGNAVFKFAVFYPASGDGQFMANPNSYAMSSCFIGTLMLREGCFSAGNAAAQLCVAFGMSNPYVVQQALHAFSSIFVPLTCNSPSALATCLLTFYNGCMQLQKLRDSKATISPQAVVRNLHRIVSACEPKAQSLDPAEASAQWVPECRR